MTAVLAAEHGARIQAQRAAQPDVHPEGDAGVALLDTEHGVALQACEGSEVGLRGGAARGSEALADLAGERLSRAVGGVVWAESLRGHCGNRTALTADPRSGTYTARDEARADVREKE